MAKALWLVLVASGLLACGGALYLMVADWRHRLKAQAALTFILFLIVEPFTEVILRMPIHAIPLTAIAVRYVVAVLVFDGYVGVRAAQLRRARRLAR